MNKFAIDEAHIMLICGLVYSQKPTRILEFGYGTGVTTDAILEACRFNQIKPDYTVVDNWVDWGGRMPWQAKLLADKVTFWEQDESEFVREDAGKYDFIVCDADHTRTQENWVPIYDRLLDEGGIVVFHDVTNPDFSNLYQIVIQVKNAVLEHALFNKNSRADEQCDRGLLVVFKS